MSLVARSAEPLEKLAADLDGAAFPVDLAVAAQLDGLVARAEADGGPLDVVVNNAAIAPIGRLVDQAPGVALQTYALNVVAPIELSRQVLPGMLAGSSRWKAHWMRIPFWIRFLVNARAAGRMQVMRELVLVSSTFRFLRGRLIARTSPPQPPIGHGHSPARSA